VLLALLALAGCRSASGDAAEKRPAPLSRESLDDLIAKGSLRPVEATPSDPAHLAAAAGDTPPDSEAFARASAKLKESRTQGLPPSGAPSAAAAAGQAAAPAPAPEKKP
jgi:hypothetical protein